MYVVWNDSESRKEVYQEFWDLDEACQFASDFVHQYDGADFRVIAHIDDALTEETIDTYENINPCDACYQEFLRSQE